MAHRALFGDHLSGRLIAAARHFARRPSAAESFPLGCSWRVNYIRRTDQEPLLLNISADCTQRQGGHIRRARRNNHIAVVNLESEIGALVKVETSIGPFRDDTGITRRSGEPELTSWRNDQVAVCPLAQTRDLRCHHAFRDLLRFLPEKLAFLIRRDRKSVV